MKAPSIKAGSARLSVYTTHFIRARLIFVAPVPISPVLGLPFQKGRARVKFWFGKGKIWYGKIIYTTKFTRAEPFFFGTRAIFIRAVPKIFCSVNGAKVTFRVDHVNFCKTVFGIDENTAQISGWNG